MLSCSILCVLSGSAAHYPPVASLPRLSSRQHHSSPAASGTRCSHPWHPWHPWHPPPLLPLPPPSSLLPPVEPRRLRFSGRRGWYPGPAAPQSGPPGPGAACKTLQGPNTLYRAQYTLQASRHATGPPPSCPGPCRGPCQAPYCPSETGGHKQDKKLHFILF